MTTNINLTPTLALCTITVVEDQGQYLLDEDGNYILDEDGNYILTG